MHMRVVIICLLIFILGVGIIPYSYADPSKPFRYLMDTPTTLLDWGILRLEMWLKGFLPDITSSVNYDWKDDKLNINLFTRNSEISGDAIKLKSSCKQYITTLQEFINKRPVNADQYPNFAFFDQFFSNAGFAQGQKPENIGKLIEDRVIIRAFVYHENRETKKRNTIYCECSLKGNSYSYSD